MIEKFDLRVIRDGEMNNCIVEYNDHYDSKGDIAEKHGYKYITAVCVIFDGKVYYGSDLFPFNALQKARRELEKENLLLVCNGSRYDVFPPAFLAQSCQALELDHQGNSYVSIFDSTDFLDKIATVDEQDIYYEIWVEKEFGHFRVEGNIGGLYEYGIDDDLGALWQAINYHDWTTVSDEFKQDFAEQVVLNLKKLLAENHPKVLEIKKLFEEAISFQINL